MNRNRSHGHITPNADGSKARCGGPALCRVCRDEQIGASQSLPRSSLRVPMPAVKQPVPTREGYTERIAALRQALEQIRAHAYAMTTSQIEATAATALRVDEQQK